MGLFKKDKKVEEHQPVISYNIAWLNKVCAVHSFVPNPNDKTVHGILGALNRSDGYCPCGGEIGNDDYKCPCKPMRETGDCKCTLFFKVPDLKSRSSLSTVTAIRRNDEVGG